MTIPAVLVLEDGTVFHGTSIGAEGRAIGEVVFNTAMTGYQEILTDPSYCRQLVTLTYPHIGNTGANIEDLESSQIYASGLIVRDVPLLASSWRADFSLQEFLRRGNVVGLAGLDTRKLTRLIREKGAQSGCIMAGDIDVREAGIAAKKFPGLVGMDLAKFVTTKRAYQWNQGSIRWSGGREAPHPQTRIQIVAYDFGIKRNILRLLADVGCRITVVPATTGAEEVLAMNPEGIFLSNGPGDPEPCDYAIEAAAKFLETDIPVFGICLGHQILALASGASTVKMKFGHHGANHPVQEIQTSRVLITSQNHGFSVDEKTLPKNLRVTHRSLFDGTLQGVERGDRPAFGFQGHPEASPGPHDVRPLFERFVALIQNRRALIAAKSEAEEKKKHKRK